MKKRSRKKTQRVKASSGRRRKGNQRSEIQQRFVNEYLRDLNGTAAAVRAGYSEKAARQQASRLLTNAAIAEAIAKAHEQRNKRTEISADTVVQELGVVGFSRITDFVEWSEQSGVKLKDSATIEQARAGSIQEVASRKHPDGSITSSIRMHGGKVPALVKLGQHVGIFGSGYDNKLRGDPRLPLGAT